MTLQFPDPAAGTPLEALAPQDDYEIVRRTLEFTSERYRRQPTLAETASALRVDEAHLEAVFRRWAGLSPKAFLQAVTIDHARRLLGQGLPLLDAAHEVGLSGPSRLHDLFVRFEAMSPGAHKERGAGLEIVYGFADGPFGRTLLLWTERGLAGIGFSDHEHGGDESALRDMLGRWPAARSHRDDAEAKLWIARVFEPAAWRAEAPLRIVLIGTDFEVRVWERLLAVPLGEATTYGRLAAEIGSPKAARAVGAAVGRNPISFVVPCHRAMGSTGALTGYHWGLTRKRAMLGWEFALKRPAAVEAPARP
ncbi:bifunctional helix-turn-helix domain-containing protein/methylated-DNA--[protein]-cysteine S-methyltransferase [Aureimonas sp. AU4]|uniref:bifunctional helix-turn-helix domain-containing protein/methylated-DNA--[protein]-cysteine S-methyltransferase n=1 Tax=Aureimonas sp. AU4 TaxID=1638163 RepID=UPI0007860CAC|nr:bifunctional helix-turn-helix domain-containing protein/methylated-DNA--[protein]-cysteine S-methyltransferase [Aureimonas sp. AU4]